MSGKIKRCAIFGANGYLAAHLARRLSAAGVECELFDLQPQARNGLSGKYTTCDILDDGFWAGFQPERYEVVFFFAGLSGVESSFRNPRKFIEVNECGLVNLLDRLAAMETKAPKVVFTSSRLVYKGGGEVAEDSPLEASSVYAANKIACEALLEAYHARWQIPYAAMRICIPYGKVLPGENPHGIISIFENQARSNGEITVYGDGSSTRTFTHVEDVCKAAMLLAEKGESGAYNVGGHVYTLQQAAELIATKIPAKVVNVPWPDDAQRVEVKNIELNADKLAKETGMMVYRDLKDWEII